MYVAKRALALFLVAIVLIKSILFLIKFKIVRIWKKTEDNRSKSFLIKHKRLNSSLFKMKCMSYTHNCYVPYREQFVVNEEQ